MKKRCMVKSFIIIKISYIFLLTLLLFSCSLPIKNDILLEAQFESSLEDDIINPEEIKILIRNVSDKTIKIPKIFEINYNLNFKIINSNNNELVKFIGFTPKIKKDSGMFLKPNEYAIRIFNISKNFHILNGEYLCYIEYYPLSKNFKKYKSSMVIKKFKKKFHVKSYQIFLIEQIKKCDLGFISIIKDIDLNFFDRRNKTLLDYAIKNCSNNFIEKLKLKGAKRACEILNKKCD